MPELPNLFASSFLPFTPLGGGKTGVLDLGSAHVLMEIVRADVGYLKAVLWDRRRWIVAEFYVPVDGPVRLHPRERAREITLDAVLDLFVEVGKAPPAELMSCLAVAAESAGPAAEPPRQMKEPPANAFAAYRAVMLAGRKQSEVKRELGVNQSTVSRWVKYVAKWVEAGNLLPAEMRALPPRGKPTAMDPRKLEEGPRLDRRHPSGRRKEDD